MQVGDVIEGKYEIVRLMGEGGMGAVYEVRHARIGRRLALKTLHPHLSHNKEMVERFLREAQTAAAIGSEYIVDITDAGETAEGVPFLVMEFLEGQDLARVIQHHAPLAPLQAVTLVHQVCLALSAAHARGIVHRDLKPQNLFVVSRSDGSDWVKVLDFGIAKFRDALAREKPELTATGAVLGTPFYMAPEQAKGTRDVDHRVDIYAAGVILYELLSGARPYEADNYNTLIIQVATTDPRPLGEVRPELPAELLTVVARALARDRDDRFASMDDMAVALRPFSGLQTLSSVPSTLARGPAVARDLPGTVASMGVAPTVLGASESASSSARSPAAALPRTQLQGVEPPRTGALPPTMLGVPSSAAPAAPRTSSTVMWAIIGGTALLGVAGGLWLAVAGFSRSGAASEEDDSTAAYPVPTMPPVPEATAPAAPSPPSGVVPGATDTLGPSVPAPSPEVGPPPLRPGVLAPDDVGFIDPRRGAGWGNRCFVHLRAGRYQNARAACNRGIAMAEANNIKGAIYYNLGWISDEEGYREEARWYYLKSLEVRPGHPSVIEKLESMGHQP